MMKIEKMGFLSSLLLLLLLSGGGWSIIIPANGLEQQQQKTVISQQKLENGVLFKVVVSASVPVDSVFFDEKDRRSLTRRKEEACETF